MLRLKYLYIFQICLAIPELIFKNYLMVGLWYLMPHSTIFQLYRGG